MAAGMELHFSEMTSTGANDLKMKADPAAEARNTKASKEHRLGRNRQMVRLKVQSGSYLKDSEKLMIWGS